MPTHSIEIKAGEDSQSYQVIIAKQLDGDEKTSLTFNLPARFFVPDADDGNVLKLNKARTLAIFRDEMGKSLRAHDHDNVLLQVQHLLLYYVRGVLAEVSDQYTLNATASDVGDRDFPGRFEKLEKIDSLLAKGMLELKALSDLPELLSSLNELKSIPISGGFFSSLASTASAAAGYGSRLDAAIEMSIDMLNGLVDTADSKIVVMDAENRQKFLFLYNSDHQQRSLLLPRYDLPSPYQHQIASLGRFVLKTDMPDVVSLGFARVNHVDIEKTIFSEDAFEQNPLFNSHGAQLEAVNHALLEAVLDPNCADPPASVFISAHLWTDFIKKVEAMRSTSNLSYEVSDADKAMVDFCDLLSSDENLDCHAELVQQGPLVTAMRAQFPDLMQQASERAAMAAADVVDKVDAAGVNGGLALVQ